MVAAAKRSTLFRSTAITVASALVILQLVGINGVRLH